MLTRPHGMIPFTAAGVLSAALALAGCQQQAPAAPPAPAVTGAAPAAHLDHGTLMATNTRGNQPLEPRVEGPVKVFDLKASVVQWEAAPGEFVEAWAYNGQVPGPLLRVTEGDTVRVNFTNELPEPTVIHFHGPTLPNKMDGVPGVTQEVVPTGGRFVYEFTANPAGMFMYHTHHNSAVQEPKGLYGLFQVDPKAGGQHPDVEAYQVISEFGGFFAINGKAFPATEPIETRVGQNLLIHLANVGQMSHPMHLHGHSFKVVATDGHPVPPGLELTKDVMNIGPGERYDLLVEADNPGTWVFHCHILSHVQNHGVEPGGMLTVVKVLPATG